LQSSFTFLSANPDFATRPRFREFRSLAAPINP
jgi:hypothetical protein